jgi:hypothetical protein
MMAKSKDVGRVKKTKKAAKRHAAGSQRAFCKQATSSVLSAGLLLSRVP